MIKNKRNIVKIIFDITSILIATIISYVIEFKKLDNGGIYRYFLMYVLFFLGYYIYKKIYKTNWYYIDMRRLFTILAINIATMLSVLIFRYFTKIQFPESQIFLIFITTTFFQLFIRISIGLQRFRTIKRTRDFENRPTAVIYGVTKKADSIIYQSLTNSDYPYKIVGIIDDNPWMKGTSINGIEVLGNSDEIEEIFVGSYPDFFLISDSFFPRGNMNGKIKELRNKFKKFESEIRVIGNYDITEEYDLMNKIFEAENFKYEIDYKDLCDRRIVIHKLEFESYYPSVLDGMKNIEKNRHFGIVEREVEIRERFFLKDKIIFITGGAGSIGAELAREILRGKPNKIVLIDNNENALNLLELEFKRLDDYIWRLDVEIYYEICNIREKEKLNSLFEKYNPNIVYHTAAYKQIPLMENCPDEVVKNNIFATRNLLEISQNYPIEKFIFLSTDGAGNPFNLVEATKKVCELLVESARKRNKNIEFYIIRFGNILGSNGSVINYFRTLQNKKRKIQITHQRMERYFMSIPEVTNLIINVSALESSDKIIVFDMGEPVKIMDLAKKMAELLDMEFEFEEIGLRDGERMGGNEMSDLINASEKTPYRDIYLMRTEEQKNIDVEFHLKNLQDAIDNQENEEIRKIMNQFIS